MRIRLFTFSVALTLGCAEQADAPTPVSEAAPVAATTARLCTDSLLGVSSPEPASMKLAIEACREKLANAPDSERDAALHELWLAHGRVVTAANAALERNTSLLQKLENPPSAPDPEVDAYLAEIKTAGIRVDSTEGMVFLSEEPGYLLSAIGPTLSASGRAFLEMKDRELAEGFHEDAALLVGFDRLAERVWLWEEWLEKNPDSGLAAEARFRRELYLGTLLSGLDNSRAWENDRPVPEARAAWEALVAHNPNAPAAKVAQGLLERLEKEDHVSTGDLNAYFKSQGLENMQGKQPPTTR